MKTGQVDFRFPVFGFTPDQEFWGFADLNTLTSCGPRTLKQNKQIGMELIDSSGRRWIVRKVERLGHADPLLRRIVRRLLSTPQSRIEQELEPAPEVDLGGLKARVLRSLGAFPEDYGATFDNSEPVDTLKAQVRAANTFEAVYDLLGLDSFMAY